MSAVICIPARMNSTRLPQKMLAYIGGKPMIRHVAEAAAENRILPVFVVTDHPDILEAVRNISGVEAVLIQKMHQSGSDRVQDLLSQIDPKKTFQQVINLQGDMPFVTPEMLKESLDALRLAEADIGTLVAPLALEAAQENSKVKVACAFEKENKQARALYFSRNVIPSNGEIWEHVGIYAWKRASLDRFVTARQSLLEQQERLEQLRALELGMYINCRKIKKAPISVDILEDLEKAQIDFDEKMKLRNKNEAF